MYENYTSNNINLDEIDKLLSDYITIHKKKNYYYIIRSGFLLEFEKNFATNIQPNYC